MGPGRYQSVCVPTSGVSALGLTAYVAYVRDDGDVSVQSVVTGQKKIGCLDGGREEGD